MKKLSLVLLLLLLVATSFMAPNSQVKAATGGYGTVNLAKGKTVTPLTNTIRGKPEDVNDGNVDSVWYSFNSNYGGNSNANSFVLDLGSAYSIGKIDILLSQAYGFTISASNDNSTWTERYKSPWAPTSIGAPISVTPDGAFSARYIKYWGFANYAQYVGVMEINVYEWLASPPPPPSGGNGSTNLALNKSVTNLMGPVVQSNPPAYAVDGNPATSWASSESGRDGNGKFQNYGQIKIDLGAKYTIGKVVISPQRVHDFRIVMAETDPAPAGSPWFFMSYPELFGATKTSGDPYTFSLNGSVTARYIWLTAEIWGTPGSLQPAIAGIEVYEWGTSSTAPTTPAPTTTQTKGASPFDGFWPRTKRVHTDSMDSGWSAEWDETFSTDAEGVTRAVSGELGATRGKVVGRTYDFEYGIVNGVAGGRGTLTLSEDGKGFTGTFSDNAGHRANLSGSRGGSTQPTPAPAATGAPALKATDASLMAEERTVSPNGKTTIPIRLDKASRLGSLNFSLRYDPAVLKVNKAESGDLAGGTLFQANIQDTGIIRFGVIAQGTAGITGDGPVAHVEFVALGARGKQSQITLEDLMATDTAGARLGVTLRAGRVTIETKMKGDYDGDGKVTAKDSLAALKMSVGALPEDLNLDMDGDGKVTAEDGRRILAGALGNPVIAVSQPAQPTTASTPPTGGQTPAALPPLVSQEITPSDKVQTVSWKDQVKVTIPAGLVDSKQTLTIASAPNLPPPPFKGFSQLAALDISLGKLQDFGKPLIVEIAYDPSKITSNYPPETGMVAAQWDVNRKMWQIVPTQVDTQRNVAILHMDHLAPVILFYNDGYQARDANPPGIPVVPAGTFAVPPAGPDFSSIETTEHFRVFYDKDRWPTVGPSDPKVGPKVPQEPVKFARVVGTYLEHAWDKYREARYQRPFEEMWGCWDSRKNMSSVLCLPFLTLHPPRVDVYIHPDLTESETGSLSHTISLKFDYESWDQVRHDSAHELFHRFQLERFSRGSTLAAGLASYVGDPKFGYVARQWWMEATADYVAAMIAWDGLDTMSKVDLTYFTYPLTTVDKVHEYDTARFIDYLVRNGVDFKQLWDESVQSYDGFVVPFLESYLMRNTATTLREHYRKFAQYIIFDASSPLQLEKPLFGVMARIGPERGKRLGSVVEADSPEALAADKTEVSYIFKLNGGYTAKLWGFKGTDKDPKKDPSPPRSLKIEAIGTVQAAADVNANVYVLKNDQRPKGGVASNPDIYKGKIDSSNRSLNIIVAQDDVVYIVALNSLTAFQPVSVPGLALDPNQSVLLALARDPNQTLTVKVTEVATPPGKLVFQGRRVDSMVTGVGNITISGNTAEARVGSDAGTTYWNCSWPEPPQELVIGQKWGGTITVQDAGSRPQYNNTTAMGGVRMYIKVGGGDSADASVGATVVPPPGQSSATAQQIFSWTIPEAPAGLVIRVNCSATMTLPPGIRGIISGWRGVEYFYNLQK